MSAEIQKKKLVKTLTFGLGKVMGYDVKKDEFVELSDEQRKNVYVGLRENSRIYGQVTNCLIAKEYCKRILEIPKEFGRTFKPNYFPIKETLEKLKVKGIKYVSGQILMGTFNGMKTVFSGEHGKELLMKGTRQLSTCRIDGTHPVPISAIGTRIKKHNDKYYLIVAVFNKVWVKQENLQSGWIAFPIAVKPRDKTMLGQLDRIIEGEWYLKNSRVFRNRRKKNTHKWLGQLIVAYVPAPYKTLSPDIIMGIDPGVNNPLCIHIRQNGKANKWQMRIGNGRQMLLVRGMIQGEIKRIIRAVKRKDSPLDEKTKRVLRLKLRDLRGREKRTMKTASQTIAATLAEVARRNGAGVWQMEDFKKDGEKGNGWLARNWAPGIVKDAIRWKAEQLGVDLRFIDPHHTSQRCSKCGHIDRKNRPKGKKGASYFKCVKCGYRKDADKNAAKNLSLPNIEALIQANKKSPNGEAQ